MPTSPMRRHPVQTSVFIATAVLFILLAVAVLAGVTATADGAVLRAIHAYSTPWLDNAAIVISDAGGVWVMLGGALLLALFSWRQWRPNALYVLVSVWGASLTTTIIKQLVARPRPSLWPWIVHEINWSFPSGHATASAAMATALTLVAWQTRWRWVVVAGGSLAVLLIGLSRMYLGVHYPSDVLGGWCVGLLWGLGCRLVLAASHANRG